MERELRKKREMESGQEGTETEGELRKEQERLRNVRYQLKKCCESTMNRATQRIFLDQLDLLWSEEQAHLTMMRESGMEIERDSGSDDTDTNSDSGDEIERVHPSLTRMAWRLRKEAERDYFSKLAGKDEHGMEMEEQLSKEHQRLSNVRCQLKKKTANAKDPATQRILLTQQEILWTKEQALLTIMTQTQTQSGMEIDKDYSGQEMGRDSPLITMEVGLSKGTVRDAGGKEVGDWGLSKGMDKDSSKGTVRDAGGKEVGDWGLSKEPVRDAMGLVVALSSHLGMLRREITFLRTEVTSRTGNKLAGQVMSNLSLHDNLLKKKVDLPYLGCHTEDAMDFLLVETHQLLYRFNSFPSIVQKFGIPISTDKIDKLRLVSSALVGISELIKRHKSAAAKGYGDPLDRAGWDATWGSSTGTHGVFDDITTLSPMQFTAYTPGIIPLSSVPGPALQIYSIKLIKLNPNLSWPIDVYGMVAVRDGFDHNLNILFRRSSANCQRIKKEYPFLHLIGPSRAIVAGEPVLFQIELKLKCGAQFEDKASFTANQNYHPVMRYHDTMEIRNCCCTAKIRLGRVSPAIQATIVGVRVVEGLWPFKSKRGNVMEKRSKSLYVINLLGGNIDRIITELRSTAAHPHTPTPTTTTHPEPY
ncbi:hypothetical protein ZWY2020_059385 [Hordeum vulgare]|nr:hypothetical protein ZWY2020_059385 [Hordeum vulgare]